MPPLGTRSAHGGIGRRVRARVLVDSARGLRGNEMSRAVREGAERTAAAVSQACRIHMRYQWTRMSSSTRHSSRPTEACQRSSASQRPLRSIVMQIPGRPAAAIFDTSERTAENWLEVLANRRGWDTTSRNGTSKTSEATAACEAGVWLAHMFAVTNGESVRRSRSPDDSPLTLSIRFWDAMTSSMARCMKMTR
jgi:hypothetical protein